MDIETKFRTAPHLLTNDEICEIYDRYPNITLFNFAGQLGLSVRELKKILIN